MGKSSSITIGYKYYLGMHMVVCQGPVDSVNLIQVGDKDAYGETVLHGPIWYKVWNQFTEEFQYGTTEFLGGFSLTKLQLFGGEREEGGIGGSINKDFYLLFGASDQVQNSYLLSQSEMTADNLPAYRGLVSFVLNRCYVSAMSPHLKPWSFKVRRIPAWEWYRETAAINENSYLAGNETAGDASANPAHILYEVLTDTEWGMGVSTGLVNDDSFRDAADTLYVEEFGMSMLLTGQDQIADFIQEILRHINGILYTDRVTGEFNLKLVRDDYDMDTLQQTITDGARLGPFDIITFDEDNILEVGSFQRPSFAEMVNEVVIKFRERGKKTDTVLTFQDSASIDIQGGIISQTLDFLSVDSSNTAAQIGMRELKQHSTPLAQVELKVNREGWDVNPGDVIRFDWSDYSISNMALRVVAVNYGDVANNAITLTCIEDIFGLPTTSYMVPQDSEWVDPQEDPEDITNYYLTEAPYFEIATGFPGGMLLEDNLTATTSFLIFMGEAPVVSRNYELWVDSGSGYKFDGLGDYTPVAQLVDDLYYTDTTDIELTDLPFEAQYVQVGSYAFIEGDSEEIVRIDAIDTDTNLVTLGRGCLDTIPAAHSAGTKIWFGKNLWGLDLNVYGAEALNVKALPKTNKGVLDISTAAVRETDLVGRQYKPYPVANVTFGDEDWSFPAQMWGRIGSSPGIQINWADRNRLNQTVPNDIMDWFDADVTPESNVIYDLYLYGELDLYRTNNPSQSFLATTLNTYDWSTEVADSELPYRVLNEDKPADTYAPLGQNIVNKSGTDYAFSDSNNITYDGGWAVFNGTDSYIDLCQQLHYEYISLMFNPTDSGDAEQIILGYYGDRSPGSGTWGPSFALGWRRADQAVLIYKDGSYTATAIVGYARPGVNNEIYIEQVNPVYDSGPPADPPGSPTTPGSITVYMNGRDITPVTGITKVYYSNDLTEDIVLGCGWNVDTITREKFFKGKITDLRIWNPVLPTTIDYTDIWDTSVNRPNRSFRARIVTSRSTVNSLQTFDYTVPQRYGWGLNFGDKWSGRF